MLHGGVDFFNAQLGTWDSEGQAQGVPDRSGETRGFRDRVAIEEPGRGAKNFRTAAASSPRPNRTPRALRYPLEASSCLYSVQRGLIRYIGQLRGAAGLQRLKARPVSQALFNSVKEDRGVAVPGDYGGVPAEGDGAINTGAGGRGSNSTAPNKTHTH